MKPEIIRAGWLIDGTGGPVQKDVCLWIRDEHVVCIKPADNTNHSDEKNRRGYTILPGLIDSHVHVSISGTTDLDIRSTMFNNDFDAAGCMISDHVRQFLSYGVAAVRDGGDKSGYALRYKKEFGAHTPLCLKVSGQAFHQAGRYGKLIGRPPSAGKSLARAISEQDAEIDHVKIINSGINSLTEFGKQTPPQFDLQEMTEAVKTAHHMGLRVMVHANGEMPVQISVEAGCDSIEHGFFMGEENLGKMADKGIFWVPTAGTMKAYAQQKPADAAQRILDHQLEQIRRAKQFGVSVALGTDAGSPGVYHGSGVIEELKLLMMAGFSIQDAIQCATSKNAELLGMKSAGILSPGMDATFIIVRGKASDLPESLNAIDHVHIRGKCVKSGDFQI